jgi:molybdopterin-binding protein
VSTSDRSAGCRIIKLPARNEFAGTIKTVQPGAATTHVTIVASPTVTITSSIADEAAEPLGLNPGMQAVAVTTASDVIVGV